MSPRSRFHLVRQCFFIAALSLCFTASTNAQIHAVVTYSDTSASSQISCYGNTCTVLSQQWVPSSKTNRSVFWRTDDAGLTWRLQVPPLPAGSHERVWKVDQVDSLTAFAVGDSGLILRTLDGGNTWQKMRCPTTSVLYDIDCHSSSEGIIIGTSPNVILTISDPDWDTVSFAPWFISFANHCHSYGGGKYRVITFPQTLYTTLDGWNSIDSVPVPAWTPDSSYFLGNGCAGAGMQSNTIFGNGDTIIAGSYPCFPTHISRYWSVLLRTFNGGKNWNFVIDSAAVGGFVIIYPLSGDSILSLDPNLNGASDTDNGLVSLSTDLGTTWNIDTVLFNKNLPSTPFCWSVAHTQEGSIIGAFTSRFFEGYSQSNGYLARLTFAPQSSVSSSVPLYTQDLVYPNPTLDFLTLASSGGTISVLDPLGRSYDVKRSGTTLDVSSLPPGVYFLSDGKTRAKFVKE
jgi:hypothetical protein